MHKAKLLFIHALTGLHPGGGTSLGVVDLPVQRERHTQWPMIAGSGLKGVLRDACRPRTPADDKDEGHADPARGDGDTDPQASDDHDQWLAAFGPETANASDFAGALAFTDARLLAFPVRSLRGVFAWVTCAAALDRLRRDTALLAAKAGGPPRPAPVNRSEAACTGESDNLIDGRRLLLEEFEFRRRTDDARTADAAEVAAWLAKRALADEATADRLVRNRVGLHDDDFTHFVRHATEVIARVGLDYETRTARGKALFYEEFLPPETLLYAVALATASRKRRFKRDAAGMLAYLQRTVPPILQIGADQTIGKGLCAIRLGEDVASKQEIDDA